MVTFSIKAKIVGTGLCLYPKRKVIIPRVDWDNYVVGGPRYNPGTYYKKAPNTPHFLWMHYRKYHMEYEVFSSERNEEEWNGIVSMM